LKELLIGAVAGMVSGGNSCGDVEVLTERMGRRIPDTTLSDLLGKMKASGFERMLRSQVRQAYESKELEPEEGWPFSLTVVDGKKTWYGKRKAHRNCYEFELTNGENGYCLKVLRAVLVSSCVKMCISQQIQYSKENDMSSFSRFLKKLLKHYGRGHLLEVLSLDAGFSSLANATQINDANRGYIIGLKGNQPELFREAKRLLARRRKPEAETEWERYKGKRIRRLLFRTDQMRGWNGWTHMRQVWRVRQETVDAEGELKVKERYFLTNLAPALTKPKVIFRAIRSHWGIENDCNWTVDVQMGEDDHPWVSAGVEVVSWLRLLAYNILQRLRGRRFRSKRNRNMPWKKLFAWIQDALVQCRFPWLCAIASSSIEKRGFG
jgi:predicted transposase YbfD/YdcC